MRQLKADKFIGARMPDQEYGPGVPAIVCLVAAGMQQARLDPVGESVSIRHPGRTAQSNFERIQSDGKTAGIGFGRQPESEANTQAAAADLDE